MVTIAITTYFVDPAYTISHEFIHDERGFFYKAWANMWTMQWQIWTYYCGFCWMEAAQIASGLAYGVNYDGKMDYNVHGRCVKILNIQLGYDLVTIL